MAFRADGFISRLLCIDKVFEIFKILRFIWQANVVMWMVGKREWLKWRQTDNGKSLEQRWKEGRISFNALLASTAKDSNTHEYVTYWIWTHRFFYGIATLCTAGLLVRPGGAFFISTTVFWGIVVFGMGFITFSFRSKVVLTPPSYIRSWFSLDHCQDAAMYSHPFSSADVVHKDRKVAPHA